MEIYSNCSCWYFLRRWIHSISCLWIVFVSKISAKSVKPWICPHRPPTHLQFQLFQTSQAYPCNTWQAYLLRTGKRKCAKEEKVSWTSNIFASLELIMNSVHGLSLWTSTCRPSGTSMCAAFRFCLCPSQSRFASVEHSISFIGALQ